MGIEQLVRATLDRGEEIQETLKINKIRRSTAIAGCALLAVVTGQLGALKYHDSPADAEGLALDMAELNAEIEPTPSTTTTLIPETTTTTSPSVTTTTMPSILKAAAVNCKFVITSTQECVHPIREPFDIPLKRFDVEKPDELQRIYELLDKVNPTPEGYQKFKIDTSRSHNLDEILSGDTIWPEYSVNHWVGYPSLCLSVDECVERMKRGRKSYTFLTMADGKTSVLAPAPHARTDHALGANFVAVGSAGNANNVDTLTPEMLDSMIYLELWMDHEYNRPMTRDHSVSHAEVSRADAVTKVDWPSQLQDGFFARKLKLNHEVYVLGQGGQPSPLRP